MKDIKKINIILGNYEIFDKADFFIVTNIGMIYNFLKLNFFRCSKEYKGFWKSILLKIGNKNVVISKIPPGNNILDYLKLVSIFKKNIILCGFAGGLKEGLNIGDFIKNITLNKNDKGFYLKQVNGLIQSDIFYNSLKKQGVDLIDMESEDLFNFGKKYNIKIKSLLIISDHIFNEPFYTIKKGDIRIIQGIEKLFLYLKNINYDV